MFIRFVTDPITTRTQNTYTIENPGTTTLSMLRNQIEPLSDEEFLVTEEGVCLDRKFDGTKLLSDIFKGKKSLLLYVIRDDRASQWIRYEVRPHDTVRLIAIKFRVSAKTVKKFNPGLYAGSDTRSFIKTTKLNSIPQTQGSFRTRTSSVQEIYLSSNF